MFVQQFFVTGLAHSSYLLAGSSTCAIIDPGRDIGVYLDAAKAMGMRITHILETHLHADFISGHMDLAQATGAPIYAPKSANCEFDHVPMEECSEFEIENLHLRVVETPGHTPEHISYVVVDRSRGDDPAGVFCGDTLFVGDVGRPDLFPGRAQELASKLFHSLHDKLLNLPDFCEVYPAHGAGSLCGRAMGAKRTSTIGYERKYNNASQILDEARFVESLTTNMPEAPDHFTRCSAINASGPALVNRLDDLVPLAPAAFQDKVKAEDAVVLDTRPYESFGGQHIPGAYHIDFGGNFATFAGWVLPPERKIALVSTSREQAGEAVVWLRRVGLDNVVSFLDGGMFAWARAGLHTDHVPQLSVHELHAQIQGHDPIALVDVRAPSEFDGFHIEGAINMPAPQLRTRHAELDPGIPVVMICSTGHRSSLAASLLKQHGFKEVSNAAGGMTAYAAVGYGPECRMCVGSHGPRFVDT